MTTRRVRRRRRARATARLTTRLDGCFAAVRSIADALVSERATRRADESRNGGRATETGTRVATVPPMTTGVVGRTASGSMETDASALRQMLVERDARLGMLRSKLDMVERENENLRRETSGRGTGTSGNVIVGGGAPQTRYGGESPNKGGVSAASAVARAEVQDLKQQLTTLRSKLAFKEEEVAEIRRAEDDARAKLRAANEERTRLAAEVRAERRARATAGQKRPPSGDVSESREVQGASKRQRTGGASGITGGASTRTPGELGVADDGDGVRSIPKPRTLTLTLPMAPPDVAATLYQGAVGGYALTDSAFARLMGEVPSEVSRFLATSSDSSAVNVELIQPVREALMRLAKNPDATPALMRALIESIVKTSMVIASSSHYEHLTSVLRVLSALAMIDARSMSIVLGACGARSKRLAVTSVTAHGAPPPSLAGIPGIGGAGMGTLVPHPRAQSSRIFVPAPMVLTNHAAAATPKLSKTARRFAASQDGDSLEAAPFLETLIRILHDAKCEGQWQVVDVVLIALIRFASDVECERGAFAAVARKRSGFGSCLKPVAPSGTRFLALMLVRALAPTLEFQALLCEPLEVERGLEKPPSSERRKNATLFGAILSCLRSDCVEENGLGFDIKHSFVLPMSAEQSGILQEAALRVLRTLAFIGWQRFGAAALDARALDVLAAVAVEEYVSPLPSKVSASNASLLHAIRLVKALLDDHYEEHMSYLRRSSRAQRVLARLAHLASAAGGRRETHMGDWLTRILSKTQTRVDAH